MPDTVRAAGAVLWRPAGDDREICVVHRPEYDDWSLPKGKLDAGEHPLAAAVREVTEETGLQARLIRPIGEIDYWFRWSGRRHFKTVHFYLMEAIGGDVSQHDDEYDVVEWFTFDDARRNMTYRSEIEIVDKAAAMFESGVPSPES